jgi:hypothetical protein
MLNPTPTIAIIIVAPTPAATSLPILWRKPSVKCGEHLQHN